MRQVGFAIILVCLATNLFSQIVSSDLFQSEKENEWVDSVFNQLSIEEQISQLIFVRGNTSKGSEGYTKFINEVNNYKPGGVVYFAGNPIEQVSITNEIQSKAKVPLLISLDGEWGLGMRLDNTPSYPYQMALGAIQNNDLIYEMGKEIARQFKRVGVHINFAPVIDVNNNPANPVINYRSFGEDPENVAEKGLAYSLGMQENGLIPVTKHFPGHGDTDTDSHLDLPVIPHSAERLRQVELMPFKYLADNGVAGTMIAHLSIPAWDDRENYPSSISKPIVSDLLKGDLGFEGLVFTDALEMKGITKHFPAGKAALESLMAGNDILLLPENTEEAINEITGAVRSGRLTRSELERRCKKILKVKFKMGLSEYTPIETKNLIEEINTSHAELVNRKLIESSLTLISDKNGVIPIKDLHTTRISSISFGSDQLTTFQDRLDDYSKVEHFTAGNEISGQDLQDLSSKMENYDLVIVGLHDNLARPYNREVFNENIYKLISELEADKKVIVVSFRNPYTLAKTNFETSTAVVTTYFDSRLSQDLAAQAIFGGIRFSGKLPVTVNEQMTRGMGISTQTGSRFKYILPEELGIDSKVLDQRISKVVQLGLDSAAYPGAQVLLAKDGKIFFHKTYGYHTYGKKQEVRKDDIYDFASVTKITGPLPALMKLHDENKFRLDATLQDYVPQMKRSNKSDLDWRNILAHNAKLKAWIPYWTTTFKKNGDFKRNTLTYQYSDDYQIVLKEGLYLHNQYRDKIFKMIRKSPLNENPGYLYSGLSFYLYPWMIENMTSQEYQTYLKENFYRKLGAYTLTYNPAEEFELGRIIPTEKDTFFRKMQIHGVVHDEGAAMMKGVSGNAGLFGTANDLAKLMQMYQNMGSFGGDQYISRATLKKFTSCQYCETNNHRGLGFDKPLLTNRENGTPALSASMDSFGHSGYTGTFTWADPETGILFVFFSNRVHPTRNNRKLYSLNIRPQIHQVAYDLLGY